VVKRYEKDADSEPLFGYRVKWPNKWRLEEHAEGVSVNERACLPASECSIRLHPYPELFRHVVGIGLEALSRACGYEVIAAHAPITEPAQHVNPCHYNLMPARAALDDFLVALRNILGEAFPTKLPQTAGEVEAAVRANAAYEAVFKIERNVMGSRWPPAPPVAERSVPHD